MREEDVGLSVDNYLGLNKEFYSAEPHEHIVRKLNLLLLYAGRPDDIEDLLAEGVEFGRIGLTVDPEREEPDSEEVDRERRNFVTIEVENLYHHTIETLLRLYLAHEGSPECPWLEISRLKTPGAFKTQLENRFLNDDLGVVEKFNRLGPVLVGIPPERFPGGPEALLRVLNALEETLEIFTSDLLEGAARYNAAKHGLVVQAGHHGMRLGGTEGQPEVVSADGPAMTYLEARPSTEVGEDGEVLPGRRKWNRVTAWLDVEGRIGAIRIAAYLLEAIWGIGKANRIEGETEVQLFPMEKNLHEILDPEKPWSVSGMAWTLLYDGVLGYEERTGELIASVRNVRVPKPTNEDGQLTEEE
jgi:hypothetical protein